eukprot:6023894-Pyramimonas_sp.AAC.3
MENGHICQGPPPPRNKLSRGLRWAIKSTALRCWADVLCLCHRNRTSGASYSASERSAREEGDLTSRTALELSGSLRNFDKTWEALYKNVLLHNDIKHVFIHVYVDDVGKTQEVLKPLLKTHFVKALRAERFRKEIVQELYDQHRQAVEEFELHKIKFDKRRWGLRKSQWHSVVSLWRKRFLTTQLRLNYEKTAGSKFKQVLILRPDLYFLKPWDIKRAFSETSISIPR